MGTNYYLLIKSKLFADEFFFGEYEIAEKQPLGHEGYEVHIGKRSIGWKPLFQTHKCAYNSVKGLERFIEKYYPSELIIHDEYSRELTPDELKEELIDWGEKQSVRYMKYVVDKEHNWRNHFIEGTENNYDITIPYDHVEYSKIETYPKIYHDKEGYNFMHGDFS